MISKYFQFQEKHKALVLGVLIILTVFFGYHASHIKIDANYSQLLTSSNSQLNYTVDGSEYDSNSNPYKDNESTLSYDDILNASIPSQYSAEADHTYPSSLTQVGPDEEAASNIVVLVDSPYMMTPVFLTTLQIVTNNMVNQNDVISCSSVFNMYTVKKKGTRLAMSQISPHTGDGPWTDSEVQELKENLIRDGIVKENLISNDLGAIMLTFNIAQIGEGRLNELVQLFQPLQSLGATISVTGGTPIKLAVFRYLEHDLGLLLSLCFLMILIVYYLSFRAKRSMLLPLSLSLVSIVWTFGTMEMLGYSITLMNVITPVMVMTLGSSYVIHLLSEYYAEYIWKQEVSVVAVATHIAPTIFLAALTTIIGFLALLISDTVAMKQFGIAVSCGIFYCAFLSLTYLPILLSVMRTPPLHQQEFYSKGTFTCFIRWIARKVVAHWVAFVVLFLLIIVGFGFTYNKVSVNSNYMSYFPSDDSVYIGSKNLAMRIGGDASPVVITLTAPEGSEKFFEDKDNLIQVGNFEKELEKSPDVRQILSFPTYISYINKVYSGSDEVPNNKGMINFILRMIAIMKNQEENSSTISSILSDDGNTTRLYVRSYDAEENDLTTISSSKRVNALIESSLSLLPQGTKVEVSGESIGAMLFSNQLLSDQFISSLLAYILVFIIATIAFKSLKFGLFPLIPVGVAIMMNFIFMYLFKIPFDMVTICFANVAIGAGVDDAIHFLIHYRENLRMMEGKSVKEVVQFTIETTGRPIVLTTLSIVAGMAMMIFGKYVPIRYFGILMSIALLNSMLATILILPSSLIFFSKLGRILKRR